MRRDVLEHGDLVGPERRPRDARHDEASAQRAVDHDGNCREAGLGGVWDAVELQGGRRAFEQDHLGGARIAPDDRVDVAEAPDARGVDPVGVDELGAMGVDPLTSLLLVVPVMAVIGYALQRGLLNRTLGDDLLPPLLVTFGLSIIIQNGLLELFTADSRRLQAGAIEVQAFELLQGVWIGVLPLLQFAIAVAVIAGLQILFYRTALGRAFRATSDDPSVAQLMGLDTRHVFAMAMALSLAVVAIAGVFLAVRTNFDPAIGPARLIFGFEAVIIGGLGSMWGTLAGGIILGVSQAIGAQIDPGWQLLAGHIVFLAILAVRPQGFFPKVSG